LQKRQEDERFACEAAERAEREKVEREAQMKITKEEERMDREVEIDVVKVTSALPKTKPSKQ
jgi:hypothetical protein